VAGARVVGKQFGSLAKTPLHCHQLRAFELQVAQKVCPKRGQQTNYLVSLRSVSQAANAKRQPNINKNSNRDLFQLTC